MSFSGSLMRFIRFILFDREARDLQTIAVHPGDSAFLSSGRGWNGFTARPDPIFSFSHVYMVIG
jgi:hypothetical protein